MILSNSGQKHGFLHLEPLTRRVHEHASSSSHSTDWTRRVSQWTRRVHQSECRKTIFSTFKITCIKYNKKQSQAQIPLMGFEHSNALMVYMQPQMLWFYVFSNYTCNLISKAFILIQHTKLRQMDNKNQLSNLPLVVA